MSSVLRRAMDLIYPKRAICMGCQSAAGFPRDWLCEECRVQLAKRWLGAFPDERLDGCAAAYRYHGPAGSMVRNLKYGGVTELADLMAEKMLTAYAGIAPTGAELVVAAPMYRGRLRVRGFNQAEVLARAVAVRLELPYENALIRTRNTAQQARLEGDERRRSLKGAIRATDIVAGKRVLLVDDVYTTGATAVECARALRAAGAKSVSFLAFAQGGQ